MSKFFLKAFADDKLNVVIIISKSIIEKGENVGFKHFLLFPKCFQKPAYLSH